MPDTSPCPSCAQPPESLSRCSSCGGLISTQGFTVEALLTNNPRGRVYRARGPSGLVALKELAFADVPDVLTVERFEREAELLRRLSHPRIPKFVASFSDGEGPDHRLYLAQAYLEGEDLLARLDHHSFDEAEARRIASDVLEVLIYLHSRSPLLIHRDLTPSNIIALKDGGHAVVNFGSTRDFGQEPSASVTHTGTFGYLPPEQLARFADPRSDLYALGVTLARVLSRKDVSELFTRSLEVAFQRWVNVTPAFAGFLARLVARDPYARFASAGHALHALKALDVRQERRMKPAPAEHPVLAAPPPLPVRRPPAEPSGLVWMKPRSQRLVRFGVAWTLEWRGQRIGLLPGGTYVLGRDPGCDVQVTTQVPDHEWVSREHLSLEVTASGLRVKDMGSTNGTQVGAVILRGPVRVVDVAEATSIHLGRVVLEVSPVFQALSPDEARPAHPVRLPASVGYLGGDPNGVRMFDWSKVADAIRNEPALDPSERKRLASHLEVERAWRQAGSTGRGLPRADELT